MAARAILAITLLLMLVAGSITWPAAASGPLCTLACCAGKAPHAAGSCMQGSCQSGVAAHHPAHQRSSHAQHHHEHQPAEESDPSSALPGAIASVGGSEIDDVPTIDATSYDASAGHGWQTETAEGAADRSSAPGMSATFLSKPCEADCGACAPGFGASKRPRSAATLEGASHAKPLSPINSLVGTRSVTHIRSALGRQSIPRGPPFLFTC